MSYRLAVFFCHLDYFTLLHESLEYLLYAKKRENINKHDVKSYLINLACSIIRE